VHVLTGCQQQAAAKMAQDESWDDWKPYKEYKLFIGGLGWGVEEETLKKAFEQFGEVPL
jgi:RNA recognition motif-containing protein